METCVDNQIYPPMDKKPIPASTSFIAELRPSPSLPESITAVSPKAKHCIRGESYCGGMDQLVHLRETQLGDEELEKQLHARLMIAAALSWPPCVT